jgi:hypothetical protein
MFFKTAVAVRRSFFGSFFVPLSSDNHQNPCTMKTRILIYLIPLLSLAPVAMAQTNIISSTSDMMNFLNTDLDYIKNKDARYSRIEGSPYLDDSFQSGSISYKKVKYVGLDLRFNPFEGYFEFQTEEGIRFLNPKVTRVDTVWLEDETYLYVHYNSAKSRKQTFMKAVHTGPTRVLLYNQVVLVQAEEATGYEAFKPARFEKLAEVTYIGEEGKPAMEFKGKKSLEEIFPEHHSELSSYAKSEKLKLKNTQDVVRLCEYYDSIR